MLNFPSGTRLDKSDSGPSRRATIGTISSSCHSPILTSTRGAHAVLIVYDVTNPDSYTNARRWLQEVNRYCNDGTAVLLVGNKADLTSTRRISTLEGQQLAQDLGLQFLETSAKDSTNVEKCFNDLAGIMLQKVESR